MRHKANIQPPTIKSHGTIPIQKFNSDNIHIHNAQTSSSSQASSYYN